MLISASYFWSDALNAFMFNHGPMMPTLMDVLMLTGLNIHAADRPFHLLEKSIFQDRNQKHWWMERIYQQEYKDWISICQGAHCLSQHVA